MTDPGRSDIEQTVSRGVPSKCLNVCRSPTTTAAETNSVSLPPRKRGAAAEAPKMLVAAGEQDRAGLDVIG